MCKVGKPFLDELQDEAFSTAIYPRSRELRILYPMVGLSAEVGELANHIKKIFRDDGGVIEESRLRTIKDELGDVWWYLNVLAKELGLDMSDIVESNLEKLRKRHKEEGGDVGWID